VPAPEETSLTSGSDSVSTSRPAASRAGRAVLDQDVDHPAVAEPDATQAVDVDPGAAQRLAHRRQSSRSILHDHPQVRCHTPSLPCPST
jgi:hypothetical protein